MSEGLTTRRGASDFGFVVDNSSCIGCHACSTACKSENSVPLGVNRTWVKTVESGSYPDTKRHFQVTRCNHCANPPCVRICPTSAMYRRPDGVVEFNGDSCIGCKACLQACPYDAIYVDPDTGTAAKCHFCSHRLDIGLEPACVVVCPEHAIIAGDMADPASEISRVLAANSVTVRKPEQGTGPKLFYIEGSDVSLHPTAAGSPPVTFAATDVLVGHEAGRAASPGVWEASSQVQGLPAAGPIQVGGRRAEHMVQVGYNAQHKVPWHWPVAAYLVTKAVGAGIFGVLGLIWLLDAAPFHRPMAVAAGVTGLAALALTTALLVLDLERPERFLYILLRPQWKSWLTRGAVLLMGSSVLGGLWVVLEVASWMGLLQADLVGQLRAPLLAGGVAFGLGTAVYTAFLFGQAEGRDLWQSPLLPVHLAVQAGMMGSGALLVLGLVLSEPPELSSLATRIFGAALVTDLLVTLLGEFGMPHASEVAVRAAKAITRGAYRWHFWLGGVVLGHLLPLGLLALGGSPAAALAALLAGTGLYFYEYAFVLAPQEIPNS